MSKLPASGLLTGRGTQEWIGRTPESMPPPRVVLRILMRQEGKCALTGVPLRKGRIVRDHIKPLIDGGLNVESNIHLIDRAPDKIKTATEAVDRAKVRTIAKKHLGIGGKKGRPMPGSKLSPWKKKLDGTVERR